MCTNDFMLLLLILSELIPVNVRRSEDQLHSCNLLRRYYLVFVVLRNTQLLASRTISYLHWYNARLSQLEI